MHSLASAAPATAYQLNIAVSVNQHHALFLSTCIDLLIYILVTFVMPFVMKHKFFIHAILFSYSIFYCRDCYCGKSRTKYQRQNNYFYHCLKRRRIYPSERKLFFTFYSWYFLFMIMTIALKAQKYMYIAIFLVHLDMKCSARQGR